MRKTMTIRFEGTTMKLCAAILLFVAACGNIARKGDDAGVRDDAGIDAIADAMPDAPPDAPPPSEVHEVVNGGAKISGATYTLEVQIGHPVQQNEISGATYKLEGAAAVKP